MEGSVPVVDPRHLHSNYFVWQGPLDAEVVLMQNNQRRNDRLIVCSSGGCYLTFRLPHLAGVNPVCSSGGF